MKPLSSIINKLSAEEKSTFRLFLASHSRSGKSKRLELFDQLANPQLEIASTQEELTEPDKKCSRQSLYQLKKRLQEQLYIFLISQDQVKAENDRLFLEMECHKKLYCFKILFDKGVDDHAEQILNEVLNIASRHSFHSLYLEAIQLRSIYFPLSRTSKKRKALVRNKIRKLRKSISRNLYVNHYISFSHKKLFENDTCFRKRLLHELQDFDVPSNEPVVVALLDINQLLCERNISSAYKKLLELTSSTVRSSRDATIAGLVYIEMTKVCICLNELADAGKWLLQAETLLNRFEPFIYILMELRFIVTLRLGDNEKLKAITKQASTMLDTAKNEILSAKWLYFSLFSTFQEKDYKKVIKIANDNRLLVVKNKSWLINMKILEVLSISYLDDPDWLFYKIENLRKLLHAEAKYARAMQIVNIVRNLTQDHKLSSVADQKIAAIEMEFPWHPLGDELVNIGELLKERWISKSLPLSLVVGA